MQKHWTSGHSCSSIEHSLQRSPSFCPRAQNLIGFRIEPRNMLRCDASRIHITPADLHGLDERIALQRRKSMNKGTTRLSLGPGLPTTFSVIQPATSVHRQQPASAASQATLCAAEDTENGIRARLRASHVRTPVEERAVTEESPTRASHRSDRSHAAQALEAILHKMSPPKLPFHHKPHVGPDSRIPSLGHRRRKTTPTEHTVQSRQSAANLHGAVAFETPLIPAQTQAVNPATADTTLPSEVHGPASTHAGRLGPFAQDRHARTRSHDDTIQPPPGTPFWPGQSRRSRHDSGPDDPQSMVEVRRAQLPTTTTLDPRAPVFAPRVRFGTTVAIDDSEDSAIDMRVDARNSLHPIRGLSDLRLRSPSEQNVDPATRSRARLVHPTSELTRPVSARSAASTAVPQSRHTADGLGRPSDTSTLPRPSPNLERYPLLLPTASGGRRRSNSGRSESSQPEQLPVRPAHTPDAVEPSSTPRSSILLVVDQADEYEAVAPTPSSSYHSPSSLPPHSRHERSSSSRDGDTDIMASRPTFSQNQRHPSMCSAASGISSIDTSAQQVFSRTTSASTLDAAAEFLRFRSSPLDDLTAELSRLSTALSAQRLVSSLGGRESRSGSGMRLLNGDPFRQSISVPPGREMLDAPPEATRDTPSDQVRPASRPSEPATQTLPTGRPDIIGSPPSSCNTMISPNNSPSHTVTTPHRRPITNSTTTPHQPHTTATPKLPIYNDATPAHLQPQTPADIPTQTRSRLPDPPSNHSVFVGRVAITSPPVIPERRFFRNTYPTAGLERTRSRHRRSASAEEVENDLEGQLVGMEADRRVWLGRRGEVEEEGDSGPIGCGLETTPPGEGRFERFLS